MTSNVTIGLVKPKSPSNVGGVIRAADCYGVSTICYTGDRYDRASRFNTDPKKAKQHISLISVSDILELKPEGVNLICVEYAEGATSLLEFKHPDQAFYVFGPEDGNLSQDLINKADEVVFIPTRTSMNLAVTVNIVLYDRMSKSEMTIANNELIRQSRDNNNKLKANIRKRS